MKTGPATAAELRRLSVYRRPVSSRANSETQLVYSCLEYLEVAMGCIAERRNVGAHEYLKVHGQRGYVQYGKPGQADIYAILPGGRHLEVECKLPGKGARSEPTAEQANWLRRCAAQGAIALCVTSVEQLQEDLKTVYKTRGWRWRPQWNVYG